MQSLFFLVSWSIPNFLKNYYTEISCSYLTSYKWTFSAIKKKEESEKTENYVNWKKKLKATDYNIILGDIKVIYLFQPSFSCEKEKLLYLY